MQQLKRVFTAVLLSVGATHLVYAQTQPAHKAPLKLAVKPLLQTQKYKKNLGKLGAKANNVGTNNPAGFVSAANNYAGLSSSVSPRNGVLSLGYTLGTLFSHGLTSKNFSLGMSYFQSPISNNPYYISNHWAYALPVVNNPSRGLQSLSVGNSQYYMDRVEGQYTAPANAVLPQGTYNKVKMYYTQPLKELVLVPEDQSLNNLSSLYILSENGQVEYFAPADGNEGNLVLVLQWIKYPKGYQVTFDYRFGKLDSVTDSLGNVLQSNGNSISDGLTWTSTVQSATPETTAVKEKIKLSGLSLGRDKGFQLSTIQLSGSGLASPQKTTLKYYPQDDVHKGGLLSTVVGPTGKESIIQYGLLPYDKNDKKIAVVSSICAQPSTSASDAIITTYAYGTGSGLKTPQSACTTDYYNDPQYSGKNYTGNGAFNVSPTPESGLFVGRGNPDYHYSTTINHYAYQNGVALLGGTESDVQTYDRLQRLNYQTVTKGDLKTNMAYSYGKGATGTVSVGSGAQAAVVSNIANTQFSNGDVGTPTDQKYAQPKATQTELLSSGSKDSYKQGYKTVEYNQYGEPVVQVSPTGIVKNIAYTDGYTGVRTIPEVTQEIIPGIGTKTTVNTVALINSQTLVNNNGSLVNGGAAHYYATIRSKTYFDPSSQAAQNGVEAQDWASKYSNAFASGTAGASTQHPINWQGYLISETAYVYGSGSAKAINTYDDTHLPYVLKKTVSYPKGTPFYNSPKVTTNLSKALDVPLRSSRSVSYSYAEKQGMFAVTQTELSRLSSASAIRVPLSSTRYYDSASGKKVGGTQPLETSKGLETVNQTATYNALGQVLATKSIISGHTKPIQDTHYTYDPTTGTTRKENMLTGYTREKIHAPGSLTTTYQSNAYISGTSDKLGAANTMHQVGAEARNILGKKTQTTVNNINGINHVVNTTYDAEGRVATTSATGGVVKHNVYNSIWTLPTTLRASSGGGVNEGNQVSLAGQYDIDSGAQAIQEPISIGEESLKTGDTLATFVAPYPSKTVCPEGINGQCLQTIVQGKDYTNETTYTYNALGEKLSTTTLSPAVQISGLKPFNQAGYTSSDFVTTTYEYDALGNRIAVNMPAQSGQTNTLYTAYNHSGKAICRAMSLHAIGQPGVNACDDSGASPLNTTQAMLLGAREFNGAGAVLAQYNGAGQSTGVDYNIDGSVNTSTGLMGLVSHSVYNHNGELAETYVTGTAQNAPNNFTATQPFNYGYNSKGELTSVEHNSAKNNINRTVKYTYLPGGTRSSITYTRNGKVTYAVHYYVDTLSGRLLGLSTSGSAVHGDQNLNYTYGKFGLKTITWTSGAKAVDPKTITKIRDGYGRIIETQFPNGINEYKTYNALGQLNTITIGSGAGSALLKLHYHYNAFGNVLKATKTSTQPGVAGTVTYQYHYNNQNQLVGFKAKADNNALYPRNQFGSIITSQIYQYGLNDNITHVMTTFDNPTAQAGERHSMIMANYTYNNSANAASNDAGHPDRLYTVHYTTPAGANPYPYLEQLNSLYTKPYAYFANGDINTAPDGSHYTYNNLNEMTELDGASGVNPAKVFYHYNVDGLLARENSSVNGISDGTVDYYYAGHTLMDEAQGNTNVFYGLPHANVVTNTDSATPTMQYLYTQAQGSVAGVIDGNATSFKHLYLYTPYGVQSDALNPVNSGQAKHYSMFAARKPLNIANNHVGYTGQQLDPSTGLMMLGQYRNYSPTLGRFIQHDSMNAFSHHATYNGYFYGSGNPIYYDDPTGNFSFGCWANFLIIGIAAATGFGDLFLLPAEAGSAALALIGNGLSIGLSLGAQKQEREGNTKNAGALLAFSFITGLFGTGETSSAITDANEVDNFVKDTSIAKNAMLERGTLLGDNKAVMINDADRAEYNFFLRERGGVLMKSAEEQGGRAAGKWERVPESLRKEVRAAVENPLKVASEEAPDAIKPGTLKYAWQSVKDKVGGYVPNLLKPSKFNPLLGSKWAQRARFLVRKPLKVFTVVYGVTGAGMAIIPPIIKQIEGGGPSGTVCVPTMGHNCSST